MLTINRPELEVSVTPDAFRRIRIDLQIEEREAISFFPTAEYRSVLLRERDNGLGCDPSSALLARATGRWMVLERFYNSSKNEYGCSYRIAANGDVPDRSPVNPIIPSESC